MAGKYSFVMDQGATWDTQLTWKIAGTPVDLGGYTARMQARSTVDATTTVFSWTSAGGQIVLGGAAGTITLNIADSVTSTYADGTYVYDLEVESSGGVTTRLLEGTFTIVPEVTR